MHGHDEEDSDSDMENGGSYGMMNGNASKNGLSGKPQRAPRFIASAARDKLILVWDIRTEKVVMRLHGHENWVRSMVFHPCGRFLISCADDKSIRVWDLSKRRLFSKIDGCHSGFIASIDWHPTESLLASVSTAKDIKIWSHDKSLKL